METKELEAELKKAICNAIAEATRIPNEFKEEYCASIGCANCPFNNVPQTVIKAVFYKDKV